MSSIYLIVQKSNIMKKKIDKVYLGKWNIAVCSQRNVAFTMFARLPYKTFNIRSRDELYSMVVKILPNKLDRAETVERDADVMYKSGEHYVI